MSLPTSQMMPSLLHFLEDNGTFASNNHTPLIAHTADDLLTTFTGLYGDRAGMPVSNSYQATTPTARPIRPGLRLLDRPDLRHRHDPERGPRHQPVHGLLGQPAGDHQARAEAGHHHPRALGAVHPGRLQRR